MASVDSARALVQKWLGDYLETAVITSEEVVIAIPSRYLPLPNGAITTAPTSILVGTSTVSPGDADGYTTERFGLRRVFGTVWPSGVQLTATYTVGWANGSEPAEIQEAITVLTNWYDTNPGAGLGEVDIGNARASRIGANRADGEVVPPFHVRELLKGWVVPGVG